MYKARLEALGNLAFVTDLANPLPKVAHLLATDPSYQRKGLASRLLSHVLAIADQEKRKCYIEATKAGFPVYYKLGFREVDVLEIDMKPCGGDFVAFNTLMIREPQPVS